WALPPDAALRLARLERDLGEERLAGPDGALVRGAHWRNFFVRYPESNRMHKKMQALSALCRRAGEPAAARRAIGRAQCNDAYWHGVFGGLYLPHLRHAIWHQLALAEGELRRGAPLAVERVDLDGDGVEEIWIHAAGFSAVVSPRGGLFVARVLPADVPLDVYASGEDDPAVSWAAEPVAAEVRATGEAVEVTCRALGLEKRLRFAAGGGLTVTYRWDAARLPATAWFAPEISLAHPLELMCAPEADVWSFPIATVSKSERGLDETVQGRSLTPRWPAALGEARIEIPWTR